VEAGQRGATYPAVLSAADEVAVELFLAGRVGFLDIPRLVSRVLERHSPVSRPTLEDVRDADRWAREKVLREAGGST
jgi:1-deoxy-D-xylulose-5-phosphate reductoisomerase